MLVSFKHKNNVNNNNQVLSKIKDFTSMNLIRYNNKNKKFIIKVFTCLLINIFVCF